MAMPTFRVQFNRLKNLLRLYQNSSIDLFKQVKDRVNTHTTATGNVHDLEPKDINLGNVPNWSPATENQAKSALSNNAFMTPRRTSDYTDENVFKVIGDAFETATNDL